MKKLFFFLLILLPIVSFAELDVDKVIKVMSSLKRDRPLKFFNENLNFKHKFENKNSPLKFTSLDEADILLMSKVENSSKLMIADSYIKLKKSDDRVIGAVYIKKDRTHIFLVKERLEKSGIHLSSDMKKYLIPECYLNTLCILTLE